MRTLLSLIYPEGEIARLMEERSQADIRQSLQTSASSSLQMVAKRKDPPSPINTELSLTYKSSSSRTPSPTSPIRTSFFSSTFRQALEARDEVVWRPRSWSGDTLCSPENYQPEIGVTKLTDSPTPIPDANAKLLSIIAEESHPSELRFAPSAY